MSHSPIQIGSAQSEPGNISYGRFPVLDLPTGDSESIPVIIISGPRQGPILWVTANIHGGELTGLASVHQLLSQNLEKELAGTVIALPSINPSGLRVMQRYPYYESKDPNRLWPDTDSLARSSERKAVYERIAEKLYELVVATDPVCLLDLHNASIDSIPFTIRDRVLVDSGNENSDEATRLADELERIAQAYGLSIVNESDPDDYIKKELHRSVAGSMVNTAGIPSLTLELGMGMAIDPPAVTAGMQGIVNVLRELDMLPGDPEPITSVPVVDTGYQVKRDDSARAPVSGIVQMAVKPGECFSTGDRLGHMVDIFGRELDGGHIVAKQDGWLIGWSNGIARYEGQVVASLATRDEHSLICPRQSKSS